MRRGTVDGREVERDTGQKRRKIFPRPPFLLSDMFAFLRPSIQNTTTAAPTIQRNSMTRTTYQAQLGSANRAKREMKRNVFGYICPSTEIASPPFVLPVFLTDRNCGVPPSHAFSGERKEKGKN